jgi:hypothetical protein
MDYKKEEEDDVRIAAYPGRGNHVSLMCFLSLSLSLSLSSLFSLLLTPL